MGQERPELAPVNLAAIMLDAGACHRPLDAVALAFYRGALDTLDDGSVDTTKSAVQAASAALGMESP